MLKEVINFIKIKIQVRVLTNMKKIYERQRKYSIQKCNEYKAKENEISLKIEQGNIEYFDSNVMAIA